MDSGVLDARSRQTRSVLLTSFVGTGQESSESTLKPTVSLFRNQDGLLQARGVFPCTFRKYNDAGEIIPHPVPSVAGRRIARFRRNLEGGIHRWRARGRSIVYVVVAMRYDRSTGKLAGNLRYATQRFVQILRRRGYLFEYIQVKEPNGSGIENHSNFVLAVKGATPSKREMKDVWAHATYGTSFELESAPVEDVGGVSRYLAKFLGSYLSKSFPGEAGLDSTSRMQRPESYVSKSRDWLPMGATKEWSRLFVENAVVWTCDRGFFHTDLRDTTVKWLDWVAKR